MLFLCKMLHLLLFLLGLFIKEFKEPKQAWGYVQVRTNASMFWWLYYADSPTQNFTELPLILWLQVSWVGMWVIWEKLYRLHFAAVYCGSPQCLAFSRGHAKPQASLIAILSVPAFGTEALPPPPILEMSGGIALG